MNDFERFGYIYLLLGVFAAIISFVTVFLLILWRGEFDLLWPLRILYLYAWGLILLFDIWSFAKFPSPFNYIAIIIEAIPEVYLLYSVWNESLYFLFETSELLSLIEYSITFKMIASFGLIVAVIALLFYMRHAIKNKY
jgi:hypothetical protein